MEKLWVSTLLFLMVSIFTWSSKPSLFKQKLQSAVAETQEWCGQLMKTQEKRHFNTKCSSWSIATLRLWTSFVRLINERLQQLWAFFVAYCVIQNIVMLWFLLDIMRFCREASFLSVWEVYHSVHQLELNKSHHSFIMKLKGSGSFFVFFLVLFVCFALRATQSCSMSVFQARTDWPVTIIIIV